MKITPLPEPGKAGYLTELVEDAKKYGANVINKYGGEVNDTFFYPAMLYPVNSKLRIYTEEQLGSVVPIVSYKDQEEGGNYVVQSNFGQHYAFLSSRPNVCLPVRQEANSIYY